MEIQIFVTLMTSAISFAGQVLSSAISQVKRIKGIASNHIYDKKFLEKVIIDSNQKFSEVLDSKSAEIKQEIKNESVRSALRDVQAHVAALKQLLAFADTTEINPQIATQLVVSALLPLHVSLEKARLCLLEYEQEDLWYFCHIIGSSTLLAGYAYLGQDMPSLREEVSKAIHESQIRMLNSIAEMRLKAQMDIPWELVPKLMEIENINQLSELYENTLQIWRNKDKSTSKDAKEILPANAHYATKVRNQFTGAYSCSECRSSVYKSENICPTCGVVFKK